MYAAGPISMSEGSSPLQRVWGEEDHIAFNGPVVQLQLLVRWGESNSKFVNGTRNERRNGHQLL